MVYSCLKKKQNAIELWHKNMLLNITDYKTVYLSHSIFKIIKWPNNFGSVPTQSVFKYR